MHKNLTTVLLLCLPLLLPAQYLETFSTPNKGYLLNQLNDFSGINWTLTPWANQPPAAFGRDIDDYFQTTAAGVLETIDTDQEVCWESPLINTAAAPTVSLAVDLGWEGFDTDISGNPCTEASLDYIKVQYSVNGGAYTTLPNVAGGNACTTVGYVFGSPNPPFSGTITATQGGITGGSNLRIRVCANANSNTEFVRIDNVSIPTTGVTLGCTAPTLSTAVTNITCGGSNSGAIDLSVAGGVPGYTYAWSNGSAQQDLAGLIEGTYTVTVTDAAACTATATATVISQPLSASAQAGPATCAGLPDGEIDLSVTGGTLPYTYSWIDLPGSNDPQDRSGLAAGPYAVTVTDNTGCTVVASVMVGVQPAGPYLETFATDGKGLLTGSVCSGPNANTCSNNNFFGVNWSIYGLAPLLGIEPDDYFHTSGGRLEGKDFDQIICWESPELDIDPPGAGAAFSVDLGWAGFDQEPPGPDPLDLVADHIDVEYRIDGGAWVRVPNQAGGGLTPHTIVYINGAGSNLGGSTTVSVSGLSGSRLRIRVCGYLNADAETMTIDNVSVPSGNGLYCPLPDLGLTVTDAQCFGSSDGGVNISVSGGTPGYTYLWSNGAMTEDLSGVPAGQYTVTVTDNAGNTITATAQVGEGDEITVSQDMLNSATILCFGDSNGILAVNVSGGLPGYTYSWSNGGNTSIISNLGSGIYSVTVTDLNGCTGALLNVVLADPPPVMGSLMPYMSVVCPGATTDLAPGIISGGAGGPYQFYVDGNIFVVPAGKGPHVVTYADKLGCSSSDTIVIDEYPPSNAFIVASDTACLEVPATYTLPGNFSAFQWEASNNGVVITGQGTSTAQVQWATPGNNVVRVYFNNADNCPDTAVLDLFVDICVGTEETALPGVRVLPNPFGDWVLIQFDRAVQPGARLWLTDAQGRLVTERLEITGQTRLETGHLPAGVYLLQMVEGQRVGVWKMAKTQ